MDEPIFTGDGRLWIWQIGTHHQFAPDDASWQRVMDWLQAGVKPADMRYASPASQVDLFGDFLICPVEPFKDGSVQRATIKSVEHRRYVPAK